MTNADQIIQDQKKKLRLMDSQLKNLRDQIKDSVYSSTYAQDDINFVITENSNLKNQHTELTNVIQVNLFFFFSLIKNRTWKHVLKQQLRSS